MRPTRRVFLQTAAALGATGGFLPTAVEAAETPPASRLIPSSGEAMPMVGLGSWITFNVGDDPARKDECAAVMAAFFESGGRIIDSSPMYGSSQPMIGHGLEKLGRPDALFSADKVWTSGDGPAQIEQTRRYWACRASTYCKSTTWSPGKRSCRCSSR
jgi:hypothetical protein